jgi:hypothetical protein
VAAAFWGRLSAPDVRGDFAFDVGAWSGGDLKPIVIKVGDITLEAELNESKTAGLIWDALPIEANGQTWGDEIYFRIPVDTELESPKATVNLGDLGYWPTGNAFCIFYGRTPVSSEDEIVPASPVDIIGRVASDVSVLKGITDPGPVKVDKGM